jgi:alkanesulfonate monooxygenase SsuD/methylene tetrahydromethanopterin reductase-like flavin-dependent oxidoreductase (luciferase family)
MLLMSEVWTMSDARDLRGLVDLAPVAERAGVNGIMIGEHVAMGPNAGIDGIPENPRDWLGERTHDPVAPHPNGLHLLSAMAAVTSDIRLLAAAIISPFRHPLVLGKELVTADLISEGRLIFLPSVSWQEEEYAAQGVPFNKRGEILNEQLEVWEKAWRDETVTHHGKHFDFEGRFFEPKGYRPSGPQMWIGGVHLIEPTLCRIVRHASGYFPVLPPSAEDLERIGEAMEAAGRSIDELELSMLVGIDTPFADATSTKPLGPALDNTRAHMANGITNFIVKPSQYIDDRDQLGDFCREALAGLQQRAGDVGVAS